MVLTPVRTCAMCSLACCGQLVGDDFAKKLTATADRVAASRLILCDARHAPSLAQSLRAFAARRSLGLAICDWVQSANELAAVQDVSRIFLIYVVFPRP